MRPLFLAFVAFGVVGIAFGNCDAACPDSASFELQTAVAGPGVTQVLTGNLDADTLTDLAIVCGGSGTIELRHHVSGTQFTSVSTLTWTGSIRRAVLADIDRDGKTDLAFTDDASRVVIARGLGDGTVVLTKTLNLPYPVFDLVAADFGNGGALEIVVSHPASGRVTTLMSTSGLTYSAVTTDITSYIADPRFLAVGKFNGDALWDVMITGGSTPRVFLLKGAATSGVANGAFTVGTSILAAGIPSALEAKDLDHDGNADVIVGSSGRVEWVYGPAATSSFSAGGSRDVASGPVSDLLTADVAGDANVDLVFTQPASPVLTAIVGSGNRTWGASTPFAVEGQPASIALADLGGSEGPDLVVGSSTGLSLLTSQCVDPVPPPAPPPFATPTDPTNGPGPPVATSLPPPPPQDPGPAPVVAAWPPSGVVVCNAPGAQSEIAGADDFAHGAYFAWVDERSGEKDVYATRIGPDGQRLAGWSANGLPVCTAPGVQRSVSCVTDGTWGVWLLWLDERNGSTALYAQKLTADGRVAAGWPQDGRQVCTASTPGAIDSYSAWPDLFGGLRLGWKGPPSSLYAQHLDAEGRTAMGWPSCGTTGVIDQSSLGYGNCGSAYSWITNYDFSWPDGLLFSRWSEYLNCPYAEIPCYCYSIGRTYVNEILGGGLVPMTSDGYHAVASYDGVGGYSVQKDGSMERFGAYGHPSWGPVPTNANRILPTPSGRFFLLEPWNPFDICRREDDGTPSPGFVAGEQPLCDPPCEPTATPDLIEDGSGGVFVVWPDSRGDLFTTWYDASGDRGPGWTSDGDPVTRLAGAEELGPVIGDHRGSLIVGWRDQRNGEWDVYARRFTSGPVLASGPHGSTSPEVAIRAAAHARLVFVGPRPNPSAAGVVVEFGLSRAGDVRLRMLDIAGREVIRRDLHALSPGVHAVELDEAHALAPGIYLVEFTAEGQVFRAKAVLAR